MTTLLILALTPEAFQATVLAWLGVISAIVVAFSSLLIYLAPKVMSAIQTLMQAWASIKGKQDEQSKRLEAQRTTLERHSSEINDISRELPPTGEKK